MPSKVIKSVLAADLTSSTAAVIRAANPGIWPTDNDVPVYLYTCLKDIWLSTGTDQEFSDRIIDAYGRGATTSDGDIEIIPLQAESVYELESVRSDEPGAEVAQVTVFLRLPRPIEQADWDRIRNAELRVRYILDHNLRYLRSRKTAITADLPTTGDTSITPGYFKCFWIRFLSPPNEGEVATIYRVEYVRAFV